jgi:predicted aspartyl protease
MVLNFPFEKKPSAIFGSVFRPVATVSFWSKTFLRWSEITMVVDTGADYTILPRYWAKNLGVNLHKEATVYTTSGVGGETKSYFLKSWKIKLGEKEMVIPMGFLDRDNVPPLLGRQALLENIRVIFDNHKTIFET